jgi:curved DNA-binding protein CbpA
MNRATGDALEWALALLRAPAERHGLRERPLPGGMDRLLGLASGATSEVSAEAARALGESESTLRDAARFYAREVLFYPQADAYRVLGLDRHATGDEIKAHHRLLQQWLHPDRARSEDDSVFSARVNSAWNHLRTEERRQAYDLARREQRAPEVFDSSGALRRLPAWAGEPLPQPMTPERQVRRLALLALFGVCLVMAWLIIRDGDTQRPDAWADMVERADASREPADPFDIRMPERSAPVSAGKPTRPSREDPRSGNGTARSQARIASVPPLVRQLEGKPSSKSAVQVASALSPSEERRVAVESPQATRGQQPPAASTPRIAPMAPPVVEARTAPPLAAAISKPVVAERAEVAESSKPLQATKPAAPVSDGAVKALFVRTQLARQAGDQLIRYLSARNRPPPPIWNSPSIQAGADRLRNDLHDQGKVKLFEPEWRVAKDAAAMTARYRTGGGASGAGQVTADLVWREGRWLVTGLGMDRPR